MASHKKLVVGLVTLLGSVLHRGTQGPRLPQVHPPVTAPLGTCVPLHSHGGGSESAGGF